MIKRYTSDTALTVYEWRLYCSCIEYTFNRKRSWNHIRKTDHGYFTGTTLVQRVRYTVGNLRPRRSFLLFATTCKPPFYFPRCNLDPWDYNYYPTQINEVLRSYEKGNWQKKIHPRVEDTKENISMIVRISEWYGLSWVVGKI